MYTTTKMAGILFVFLAISAFKPENNNSKNSECLDITVEGNHTHQTVHSFGASDAWSCQFIGNWPEAKKNQMAEWLFSNEMDKKGNALGIGLSCWRFNIGGGSAEQQSASGIKDEWRRSESFLNGTGQYDWSKHQGQRWFLQAAKKYGVKQFTGFVNSPPVSLTRNQKAFSSDKDNFNMPAENYEHFATYLADVITHFKSEEGIHFEYISPINEPQWDWIDGGQEGTPATNIEVVQTCRVIDRVFKEREIQTKIDIPESAQLNYLYENDNRPGRGNQINSFFNPSSVTYIGNLKSVAKKIAGHSYFTTWPLQKQSDVRTKLRNAVTNNPEPIEFWMTEYCLLEDNEEIKGNTRDLTMKTALYVARVIFSDLVFANACSWQWWVSITPYDYKDGLIYTDKNKTDGNFHDSKLLWTLGNFSRFIRPEMKRVTVSRNDGLTDEQTLDQLMATAFVSDNDKKLTVVVINQKENEIPLKMNFSNLEVGSKLKIYLTDDNSSNNLTLMGHYTEGDVIKIPPRSVVTITNQY